MHVRPEIGEWYINQTSEQQFEVVAIDVDEDAIEIQHFGGEIEELDFESWFELPIISCAPPEDWSGPYEMDDTALDETEESMHPDYPDNPLDHIQEEEEF